MTRNCCCSASTATGWTPSASAVSASPHPRATTRCGSAGTSTAPNFAEYDGQPVDTSAIAAAIAGDGGEFTGLRQDAPTILATMERPQGRVLETYAEFLEERARLASEIPGYGPVSAKALIAAGGWCSWR